jgi:glyoxylase-like metal-dependent hydrolase (beta-lactamase superfamily II)
VLAALAAVLIAAPLGSARATNIVSPLRQEDGYLYEARRLTDRVHVIAQPQPFHLQPLGNVTVVEQADGLVLVDAGGSRGSAERVIELVRTISNKPVKAVIITHWHGDHPLGAATFRKAWPKVEIIATNRTRDHLLGEATEAYPRTPDASANQALQTQIVEAAGRLHTASAGPELTPEERSGFEQAAREVTHYARDMDGTTLAVPTRTFTEQLVLADRAAPVEVSFFGRANTDGDAVVWLPKQRVLATGDVVVAPFPFGFGSYPAEWLSVLEKLKRFDFAYLVPGHGAVQTDRRHLDRMAALIADTRAQVGALVAKGASLDDVRGKVDLRDHARVLTADNPWLRRWFDRYWTEPFVASAYKEAKGEPISQAE